MLFAAMLSAFASGDGALVVQLPWSDVCICPLWERLMFHPVCGAQPAIIFVVLELCLNLRLFSHEKFAVLVNGLSSVIWVSYPCDTS